MQYQGLSQAQVMGLVDLLDPTNAESKIAMKRPEGQLVGYSLSENDGRGETASTSGQSGEGTTATGAPKHSLQAVTNPGAIYVPESQVVKRTLPMPSQSKEVLAQNSRTNRTKPKGNDIWAAEEIDYEVNAAPRIQAPATTAPQSTVASGEPAAKPVSAAAQSTPAVPVGPAGRAAVVDRRLVPQYEILYKQTNTAEDVYLAMDFTRDGSTAMSCDSLLVKVKLPLLDDVKDVELDIDATLLTLRTKEYHLKANLPERCIPKKGAAQWDSAKKMMNVTVYIDTSDRKVKVIS